MCTFLFYPVHNQINESIRINNLPEAKSETLTITGTLRQGIKP